MNEYPKIITGNWDKGWVLDKHVINSTYIGDNPFGHAMFDTQRSELGELIHLFKNRSMIECLEQILEFVFPFLDELNIMNNVDVVFPAPFSKQRDYQPASKIAEAVAEKYNKFFSDTMLLKTDNTQSKDMVGDNKKIDGTIIYSGKSVREYNILLIDDLYGTGSTLNECVKVLKADTNVSRVYVLAMTKTKGEV